MKARARHSSNRHAWRRLLWAGGVLVIVAVVAVLSTVFYGPRLFSGPALTELVIPGPLKHVQPQAVRAAVLPALQGKGFFSVNVALLQADVQTVPWVATASVRRSWPHTLYIDINEEVPVARWNGNGLMDANGRVFVQSTNSAWSKLPSLNGSTGSEQDVLAEFNELATLLAPHDLAMQQLTVDARGDTTVLLNDGIQVRLGRIDVTMRLSRFVTVALPTLREKLTAVAYVDMRYTNGFAVGWKSQIASSTQHKEVGPNG